jgi:AAA15 family ATPase/GTPase
MIKCIRLRNFKSHRSTDINFKPISILIGNNNTGKSSIYQSLLLLKDAVKSGHNELVGFTFSRGKPTPQDPLLYKDSRSIDAYNYEDITYKTRITQQAASFISIGVSTELIIPERTPVGSDRWQIEMTSAFRQNRLVSHSGSIVFSDTDNLHVQWSWDEEAGPSVSPPSISFSGAKIDFDIQRNLNFLFSSLSFPPNISSDTKESARNLSHVVNELARRLMESFRIIYPIRGLEESVLPLPMQSVSSEDRFFLADRQVALATLLSYDRTMENLISEELMSMFGVGVEVENRPPYQILVKTKIPSKDQADSHEGIQRTSTNMFVNEGLGINQLLFMLVPLAFVGKGETAIICEPEAHLNPMVQSRLVESLVGLFKKRKIQLIIETHSEHILNAFILGAMRKEIPAEDLGIFHFEIKDETSSVRELEMGKDGRLKEGLPGFFDVNLDELSQILRTLSK